MKSKIIQILSYSLNTYTNHYPVLAQKIQHHTQKKKKKKNQKRIQLYIEKLAKNKVKIQKIFL